MNVSLVQDVYNELSWFPAIVRLDYCSNSTDDNNHKK